MNGIVEHELCNNCKREVPQPNYIIHTIHCARNITLCKQCNEPIVKSQFSDHEKSCKPLKPNLVFPSPTNIEKSPYFQTKKATEDKKIEARKGRYIERMDELVDIGYSLKETSRSSTSGCPKENIYEYSPRFSNDSSTSTSRKNQHYSPATPDDLGTKKEPLIKPTQTLEAEEKYENKLSGMLVCKYCDLELPKLELEDHENYCGSRTDKCLECGELVLFKDKRMHMASNHSAAARRDNNGRSSRPLWDSDTQRSEAASRESFTIRPSPFRPVGTFDYDPMPYLPSAYQAHTAGGVKKKDGESYKEISRRLDCKTEYIRNLLHDSATITIPLRRNGTTPRNHFNHNKGAAPQPPYRRRNPPTELIIPCEFCGVPVPHEDLIDHETGCRPDLARYSPRNRAKFSPERDDHLTATSSPDVELPCEFCGDMIPASQLYSHQIRCN